MSNNTPSTAATMALLALMIAGACTMFWGAAIQVGLLHRSPTTITLKQGACDLLPLGMATQSNNGCRVAVDDFQAKGKLAELWMDERGQLFRGHSVIIPTDSVMIAVARPSAGVPAWVYLVEGGGFILMIAAIISMGLAFRSGNKPRKGWAEASKVVAKVEK